MPEVHIDPIVVRKTRDRLSASLKDAQVGTAAAAALLWFSARDGEKASGMFSLQVTIHDSTGLGKEAGNLLQAATGHFLPAILAKAIEIAQAQLQAAEKAIKEAR